MKHFKYISTNSKLPILVVDDLDEIRDSVREALQLYGFTDISTAASGKNALEVLEAKRIELVISDWEMPEMNGMELLKYMRADVRFSDIPFVMITAPISQERMKVENAASAEVDAYIIKPFQVDTLLSKINAILSERRQQSVRGALVIDDDEGVRESLVEFLKSLGYFPVFEASDGNAGLQLLRQKFEEISFVISDWEMPQLTGIELLRKVRMDQDLYKIPFIMVTSQSSIEHLKLDAAVRAEVDHYLLKPFSLQDLEKKIALAITKSKSFRKVEMRLHNARIAFKEKDYSTATQLFHHVLTLDARNVDAYLGLAAIRLEEKPGKGFDDAVYFIKEAIQLKPSLSAGYIALALVYERAKSLEKAVVALREGIVHCPNSAKLYFHLGRILGMLSKEDEAREKLEEALRLDPNFQEAALLLGRRKKAS